MKKHPFSGAFSFAVLGQDGTKFLETKTKGIAGQIWATFRSIMSHYIDKNVFFESFFVYNAGFAMDKSGNIR